MGKEVMYKGLPVKLGKTISRGQFLGGTKHFTVESLEIGGKKFDSKTDYGWDDPDFPDDATFSKALEKAKEKDDVDNITEYIDWSGQEHSFKSEGFMIIPRKDGSIDINAMPDSVLGRLDLDDLLNVKNGEKLIDFEKMKRTKTMPKGKMKRI